jgi:hypothetical protein
LGTGPSSLRFSGYKENYGKLEIGRKRKWYLKKFVTPSITMCSKEFEIAFPHRYR